MKRRPFPPLKIAVHGHRGYRSISTVHEAYECLTTHWPAHDGVCFIVALETCLDAMDDKVPPEAVRQAVIKAAEEAQIAVIT